MMGFEESVRSPKVLQGQENSGFMSLYYGCDKGTNQPGFDLSSSSHYQNLASTGIGKVVTSSELMSVHPFGYAGFMESNNFPRVLQGQEICKLKSLTGKVDFNVGAWGKSIASCTNFSLHQGTKHNFQSAYFPYGDIQKADQANIFSSKHNVGFNAPSTIAGNIRNDVRRSESNLPIEHKLQDNISVSASLGTADIKVPNDNNVTGKVNSCKIFGFPLSAETSTQNLQNTAKRSCTKVRDDDNHRKIL